MILVSSAIRKAPKNRHAMTRYSLHEERYCGEGGVTGLTVVLVPSFWSVAVDSNVVPIVMVSIELLWWEQRFDRDSPGFTSGGSAVSVERYRAYRLVSAMVHPRKLFFVGCSTAGVWQKRAVRALHMHFVSTMHQECAVEGAYLLICSVPEFYLRGGLCVPCLQQWQWLLREDSGEISAQVRMHRKYECTGERECWLVEISLPSFLQWLMALWRNCSCR